MPEGSLRRLSSTTRISCKSREHMKKWKPEAAIMYLAPSQHGLFWIFSAIAGVTPHGARATPFARAAWLASVACTCSPLAMSGSQNARQCDTH